MKAENKNKILWALITSISVFVSIPGYYTAWGNKGLILLGFIGVIFFLLYSRIKLITEDGL